MVRFGLPEAENVRLAAYDALGRRVPLLADGAREAGWHEATLDGHGLSAGLYVVRLEAGGAALVERFTLVR